MKIGEFINTLKVYAHLMQKTDEKMMDIISKLRSNGGIMVADF